MRMKTRHRSSIGTRVGMTVLQLDDLWKYAASGSNPAAV
jgi:hypothetical protein